ncbi:amidase family protein [Terrilactibacillus laevilacticus]|uniref:Amidase family protein n=1 Tax=Terrilactibacillus laevilacticus TaxID=1380157 RepID=A0ABW5PN70_9BACI|nr:amidase family protein [Terrilactibacillus laevilacticus]
MGIIAGGKSDFILEASVLDMHQAMESGDISSKELVQMYLDRIENYDKKGPNINSILEVNPDALMIADKLDQQRPLIENRGPLYGIPVIIKDNIDTADHMHTSAGSVALANHTATEDAFIVKKLRDAGAIILGKANMTELANFVTEGMPNGYSSRGGQVLNPYDSSFEVGGSSSGTGAAIAANFAAVGVGTETSGSILMPASVNSLVGIKPTIGLVSRAGIIPLSHTQDTAGPMTRSVTDAAILLNAIVGIDEKDDAAQLSLDRLPRDYMKYLNGDGLNGSRIGVDRRYLNSLSQEEQQLIDQALGDMKKAGAIIVESIIIPSKEELDHFDSIVMYHDFKMDINQYLNQLPPSMPVHSLSDLIEYNNAHADIALKYGQTILERSEKTSGDPFDPQYLADRALDIKLSRTNGIDPVMKEYELDALVFENAWGSDIAARAGYPSITVPAGYTNEGTPVGVTFTTMAFQEPKLFELAFAYEQQTKHRKAPTLE